VGSPVAAARCTATAFAQSPQAWPSDASSACQPVAERLPSVHPSGQRTESTAGSATVISNSQTASGLRIGLQYTEMTVSSRLVRRICAKRRNYRTRSVLAYAFPQLFSAGRAQGPSRMGLCR
jgi:hypothetical protein